MTAPAPIKSYSQVAKVVDASSENILSLPVASTPGQASQPLQNQQQQGRRESGSRRGENKPRGGRNSGNFSQRQMQQPSPASSNAVPGANDTESSEEATAPPQSGSFRQPYIPNFYSARPPPMNYGDMSYNPMYAYGAPPFFPQQAYYPPAQTVPVAGGAPDAAAAPPKTSGFVIPVRERKVLQIVNPANKQVVKLPEPPATTAKTPPVTLSAPPAAAAPVTAAVPVPAEKKVVLKNPTTGKVIEIAAPEPRVSQAAPPVESKETVIVRLDSDTGAAAAKAKVPEPAKVETPAAVPTPSPQKPKEQPTISVASPPKTAATSPTKAASSPQSPSKALPKSPLVRHREPHAADHVPKTATFKVPAPITPATQASPTSATGKSVVSEPADELEDGEVQEPTLPANATAIADFGTITYPATLKCVLPKGSVPKYSSEFMIEICKRIKLRPQGLLPMSALIDDEISRRSTSSKSAPRMERHGSSSGGYRGGDRSGSFSGGSKERERGFSNAGYSSASGGGRGGNRRESRGGRSGSFRGESRSSRGGRRDERAERSSSVSQGPVAPLVRSENAWVPVNKKDLAADEVVVKSVKGLLNKLTVENFVRVADKILRSDLTNPEILVRVIELVFGKAVDEPHFGAMYARLCGLLMTELPGVHNWVHADAQKNQFRILLLKKCQNEFESDAKWTLQDDGGLEERQRRRANIASLTAEEKQAIAVEDYERAKAKRHSLGNIQFVGELYINGMISEAIIHRCIIHLLQKIREPEEEEVESLCKLMTTIGRKLDEQSRVQKAVHMDQYFSRIAELSVHVSLTSRIRFMAMDVIDLRKNNWVQRATVNTGPTTIAQVHREAEEQKRREDRERQMNRSGSGRGGSGSHGRAPARAQPQPSRRQNDVRVVTADGGDGWTAVSSRGGETPRSGFPTDSPVTARNAWGVRAKGAAEEPEASKPQNQFSILQRSEAAASVPATPALKPAEKLEKSYKEFKQTLELAELLDDFKDLDDVTLVEPLIKLALQHILDSNAKHAPQIVKLFTRLLNEYDSDKIWNAFASFLTDFESDLSDFPRGFHNFAEILSPLYSLDLFKVEDMEILAKPFAEYGGALPAGPKFLAAFLESLSPEDLIKFLTSDHDISVFWPAFNSQEFNKWIAKYPALKFVSSFGKIAQAFLLDTSNPLPPLEVPEVESEATKTLFRAVIGQAIAEVVEDVNASLPPLTREKYAVIQGFFDKMKPLFDSYRPEDLADLLSETSSVLLEKSCDKTYFDAFFRILRDTEIVPRETHLAYQAVAQPGALKHLEGWFKSLEEEEDEDDA